MSPSKGDKAPESLSELEKLFSEAEQIVSDEKAQTEGAPIGAPAAPPTAAEGADIATAVWQAETDMTFSEADLMTPVEQKEEGKKRVLLIDDDPDIIEILKVRLEGGDYQCVTTMSGPEALGLVQRDQPDLAVIDVLMPGMDGYEVCRQMIMQFGENHFPVILMSEKSDTESIVRALDLGAADFVRKPIDAQELMSRMKTVLQLRENLRSAREQIKELTHINSTLVRSNAKLAAVTVRDELTGLFNRGHFLERVQHEVALTRISKQPLALALYRFRTIAGGAIADEGLPGVAKQLLDMVRSYDLCARVEPIMFAVLMPVTELKEARTLAEKWHRLLGQAFGNVKSISLMVDALKPGENAVDLVDRLEYGEWPD